MGFQRSVWGCVGRKRLEANPEIHSTSVLLMVVFPYAEEVVCVVLYIFLILFSAPSGRAAMA